MDNLRGFEITTKGWNEYAKIKITSQESCQSCSKGFISHSIVFFAPLDNTIICRECTKSHAEVEVRLVLKDKEGN